MDVNEQMAVHRHFPKHGMRLKCDRFMQRLLLPPGNIPRYPKNKGTNGLQQVWKLYRQQNYVVPVGI
jgi:ribosomal protein L15